MSPLSRADAATLVRDAMSALSGRLASDVGDLVPEASTERTASLVAALEQDGPQRIGADELQTLDAWIRLADSAVLHDDPDEAETRSGIAHGLRAVRVLVAPGDTQLTEDQRGVDGT